MIDKIIKMDIAEEFKILYIRQNSLLKKDLSKQLRLESLKIKMIKEIKAAKGSNKITKCKLLESSH